MLGILGRLLPWIVIFVIWYQLNRALDKIDAEKAKAQVHPFWKKLYFLWGWTLGARSGLTVIRYLVSGILMFIIIRWAALMISTPLP